jgi:DNA polymerase-3 subunit epsilon
MRLIFVDTETTGFAPHAGHRMIEVACVEMVDGHISGREFHSLINPERNIPAEAFNVHGIDDLQLHESPFFHEIAEKLITFVANGTTVMHNAPFDTAFFAAEFARMGLSVPGLSHAETAIDTLKYFRKLQSGKACSLSELCKQYGVLPVSNDKWHSALTDARMLARLWLSAGLDNCNLSH